MNKQLTIEVAEEYSEYKNAIDAAFTRAGYDTDNGSEVYLAGSGIFRITFWGKKASETEINEALEILRAVMGRKFQIKKEWFNGDSIWVEEVAQDETFEINLGDIQFVAENVYQGDGSGRIAISHVAEGEAVIDMGGKKLVFGISRVPAILRSNYGLEDSDPVAHKGEFYVISGVGQYVYPDNTIELADVPLSEIKLVSRTKTITKTALPANEVRQTKSGFGALAHAYETKINTEQLSFVRVADAGTPFSRALFVWNS